MPFPDNQPEDEDIDRSPPIGVFLSGEAFLKSAKHLHSSLEAKELRLKFDMPVYYLYCHAIELALKAFLRAKGLSAEKLASREYGHRLQVVWNECKDQGLTFDPITGGFVEQCIELLHPYAVTYEFRYIKVGSKELPVLDAVRSTAEDVFAAVRPVCAATVSGPIPDSD